MVYASSAALAVLSVFVVVGVGVDKQADLALNSSRPNQVIAWTRNPPVNLKMGDELMSIPNDLRHLRACLLCSLVKSFEQFEFDGCDNCEEFLGMKNNREMVYDCTSNNFDGLIALTNPEDSWVAKWQKINRKCIGIYAISVSGRLPSGIVRELKSRGVVYRSRDRSTNV